MTKTIPLALATLAIAFPAASLAVPAEDPWGALVEAHLGGLPATAEVDGATVPLAEALDRLRHLPLPGRAAAAAGAAEGGPEHLPDVGVVVRDHNGPCEFTAYVVAIRRGVGPAAEALTGKTIVPAPGGLAGVTACAWPWTQGTATAEVPSQVIRRDACVVDRPTGTWAAIRGNCHYDDFGTATIHGKVGFADYFFRIGENWLRFETMYGAAGPSPLPVGRNQPDLAVISIGA